MLHSLTVAALTAQFLSLTGCQQKMAKQPSYRPLQQTNFFADSRASRPLVPGTVPQGAVSEDDPLFYTGKNEQHNNLVEALSLISSPNPLSAAMIATSGAILGYTTVFPYPVTKEVLERGRERFTVFCVVCHDPSGNGNGKIVQRGYTRPPSFITDRSRGLERRGLKVLLRDAPVGYYFEVITNGYGAMPDYSVQVPPRDRWAIIAYIRALQLSQYAPLEALPHEDQQAVRKVLEAKP